MDYIEKSKQYFLSQLKGKEKEYYWVRDHLPSVEKVAKKIMEIKKDADIEIVLIGVWLHDLGVVMHGLDTDHAVSGENEARKFLQTLDIDTAKTEAVLHCVRAHRNKDVPPNTLEAKIVAVSDSLSHMLEPTYIFLSSRGLKQDAKEKLERDYRDKNLLPGIEEMLDINSLYEAWKKLLDVYPE